MNRTSKLSVFFRSAFIGLAGLALFFSACATSKVPSQAVNSSAQQNGIGADLVIVATSDFHAQLDKAEGFVATIEKIRAQYGEKAIFLDGGDLFQGSIEGNISKGRAVIEVYNTAKIDAVALGNHDLDYGPDVIGRIKLQAGEDGLGNIKARVKESKFKWLSSNFISTRRKACVPSPEARNCNALGQPTVFPPHAVFQRAGQKVCVIGATTPGTKYITWPDFVKGTDFMELAPVVEAEAKFLRSKLSCDFVLLISHAGLICNKETQRCLEQGQHAEILRLLETLPAGTLDAVVAGHTHQLAQEVINGTPVIEPGSHARAVGVLELRKLKGELNSAKFVAWNTVPEKEVHAATSALMQKYRTAADSIRFKPVGASAAPFIRDYNAENPLGNLVADALLEGAKLVDRVNFMLSNSGGLRADLPMGPLNYENVFKVIPFDNSLAIADLTGKEIRRLLEISLSGAKGMAIVSGLQVRKLDIAQDVHGSWDRDLNGDGKMETWERNLIVEVYDENGNPLQDEKMYKLATHDFLTAGGDFQSEVYSRISPTKIHIYSGIWIRDLLAEYLKNHPNVDPKRYFNASARRIESLPLSQ